MLGLTFLLLASAASADPAPAAATAPADPAPITSAHSGTRSGKYKLPPIPEGPDPMRRLIDAQNQSAPRTDGSGGMSGAEADVVMAHYLASIGKRLNPADENVSQGNHR